VTSPNIHIPWNYEVQEYKEHDPFCEPGLVSVLFLSCGKPKLTSICLESTKKAASNYVGDIEWLFLEQGECEESYEIFKQFPADRKVIVRQKNYGINNGFNQLWSLSRGEYGLVMEQDWYNNAPTFNFIGRAIDILIERTEVGIVQLRSINDPNENWGFGKPEYNPWSVPDNDQYKVFSDKTLQNYEFLISQFPNGFNNNPCLMRKSLWRECGAFPEPKPGTDPRHGETDYQGRVAETGCATAHINKDVYYHAGGSARRLMEGN